MYIIVELQTSNGSTANITYAKATRQEAESTYHSILASAAISSVEKHAAVLLTDEGQHIMSQCYIHPIAQLTPEPEPVEE